MISYEDVRWGIQGCQTDGCPNDAELIWDGRELYCVDCADKLLERLWIIAEYGHDYLQNLAPVGEWFERVDPFRDWMKENERTAEA